MPLKTRTYTITVGKVQQIEVAQGEDCALVLNFVDAPISQGGTGQKLDFTNLDYAKLTVRDRNGLLIVARLGTVNGPATDGSLRFQLAQLDTNTAGAQAYDVDVQTVELTTGYLEQILVASPFELLELVGNPADPATSPPGSPVTLGLRWLGAWSSSPTYQINDAITYPDPNGGGGSVLSSFRAVAINTNVPPLDVGGALSASWQYIAERGGTYNTQAANTFLAGPTAGPVATAQFRQITVADLPTGIPITSLSSDSLTVNAGTGLTGGGSVQLGQVTTISMPSVGPGAGPISLSTGDTIALDAQGRVTAVTPVVRTLSAGAGLAGGGTLAADRSFAIATAGVTNAMLANPSLTVNTGNGLQGGQAVALGAAMTVDLRLNAAGGLTKVLGVGTNELGVAAAGVTNAMLVNPSLTVTAGTGLTGGGAVALGAAVTLSLPAVGPGAGLIGGSGIASITLDAQGRVTAAATAAYLTSAFYQAVKNSAGVAQTQRTNLKFGADFAVSDAAPDTVVALAANSVTVTAGAGLSGGGAVALGGSVALALALPNVGPGAGAITFATGDSITLDAQGRVTADAVVTRSISAGAGLTGGGTLAANRTLAIDYTANNTWTGTASFTGATFSAAPAGALTLTAGTTSSWDTKDGTIKAATLDRTTAGTLTLGGTAATVALGSGALLQAVNSSYATGNVTLKYGNVGGSAAYALLESATPTDVNGAATWYDTMTAQLFFGTKRDWTRTTGWNLTANGARVDTADAAIGDQWESHYDADATHSWVERHVVFIGTDGTYTRPWTIQVARTASANPIGYTNFGLAADVLWVSGNATGATQNFVFLNPASNAAGQLQVANGSQVRLMTNNTPQLVQVNAAGSGTYQLAYVAADNNVYLADSTTGAVVQGTSISLTNNTTLAAGKVLQATHNGYAGGNITLKLGNVASTGGYGMIGSVAPTDPNGVATWYDTISATLFHGTRKDWTRVQGWNLNASGTRVDLADAGVGDQCESYYEQDASNTWLERHFVYVDTNGSYYRPLSFQMGRTGGTATNGGVVNGYVAAASFTIYDSNGPSNGSPGNSYFRFAANPNAGVSTSGWLEVANNGTLRKLTNNQQWLWQANAANNQQLSIAYIDASNQIQLGVGGSTGGNAAGVTIGVSGVNYNNVLYGNVNLSEAGDAVYMQGDQLYLTRSTSQYIYNFGTYYAAGQAATAGAQLQASPVIDFRGFYWNGSVSTAYDVTTSLAMDTTGPTAHLVWTFPGAGVVLNLNQAGTLYPQGAGTQSLGGPSNHWGATYSDVVYASTVDTATALQLNIGTGIANNVLLGSTAVGNLTIRTSLTGYVQYSVGSGAGVYLGGGVNASAGTTTINSPLVILRGTYWTGAASANSDLVLDNVVDTTGPTNHLSLQFAGAEKFLFNSAGNILLNTAGATVGLNVSGAINFGTTSHDTTVNLGGASTGAMAIKAGGAGGLTFTENASSGSPGNGWAFSPAAHTALTTTLEHTSLYYNGARTVQFATGAIATQREIRIDAPTYSFVGASTITTAATFAIAGAPAQGTNASITNSYAFWVQAGGVNLGQGTVTQLTSITTGVTVNAASGVITTVSSTLAAATAATFTVTNNCVKAGSVVMLTMSYQGTISSAALPQVYLGAVSAGSFTVTIYNAGSGALSNTMKIHYLVC